MSWICLIRHKWVYKVEDIFYINKVYRYLSKLPFYYRGVTKSTNVRLCVRCYKKQKSRLSGLDMLLLSNENWNDCDLTKEEEREKKLNKLGI